MSRFDDDLRAAAAPMASEPLPDDTLHEALDSPAAAPGWPILAGAVGVVLTVAVTAGIGFSALLPTPPSDSSPTPSTATSKTAQRTAQASASPQNTPVPSPTPLPTLSAEPPDYAEATCENDEIGYVVAYPESWFVHPPIPGLGVNQCQFFGPDEFSVDGPHFSPEASVAVNELGGSCLGYDAIFGFESWGRYAIDGYPALRVDARAGGRIRDRSYIVNLRPEVGPVMEEPRVMWEEGYDPDPECEGSLGLWLLTRDGMTGDYEDNRAVLDRMAATLQVSAQGSKPASSLPPMGDWGPLAVWDDSDADGSDFAGWSGTLVIGDECVAVGGSTMVWGSNHVRWDYGRRTILFLDPLRRVCGGACPRRQRESRRRRGIYRPPVDCAA